MSCGTKSLPKISSQIEGTIAEVGHQIDATYLTECYWEDKLFLVTEDKPVNYLLALQELKLAYSDCYLRHNELVKILTK